MVADPDLWVFPNLGWETFVFSFPFWLIAMFVGSLYCRFIFYSVYIFDLTIVCFCIFLLWVFITCFYILFVFFNSLIEYCSLLSYLLFDVLFWYVFCFFVFTFLVLFIFTGGYPFHFVFPHGSRHHPAGISSPHLPTVIAFHITTKLCATSARCPASASTPGWVLPLAHRQALHSWGDVTSASLLPLGHQVHFLK